MTALNVLLALSQLTVLVTGTYLENEIVYLPDHTVENDYSSPLPHTSVRVEDLPDSFSWENLNGKSYLTKSLNQHIHQYCGSCWAHGALSALADRIKIARDGQGDDINLSIQYVLNCGGHMAGSCNGGSHSGTYQFIKETGFVPYDTCQPYLACSSDSDQGFCPHVDTTCNPFNTCRTCSMNLFLKSKCAEIDIFPNASIAEYGVIASQNTTEIMAEIFARGPVAAAVNGQALHNYTGGVFDDATASKTTTHIVSIVGWGLNETSGKKYWIVRNSWGQYWGLMGYCHIEMGSNILGIEHKIAWATPGPFTVTNYPCDEDGSNCGPSSETMIPDNSWQQLVSRRLALHRPN